MRIYIVRHGESYSNIQGKMMSTTDLPLTEKGILQAEAARAYIQSLMREDTFSHVFASTLQRAVQTAAIICADEPCVSKHKDLMEMNLGKLEGLTWTERYSRFPGIDTESALSGAVLPDGESFEDIRQRCRAFIQAHLTDKANDEMILIASHGIAIRVLINCLMNRPPEHVNYINWPDNTAITVIERPHGGKPSLLTLNDRSHLIKSGLGTENYDTWGIFAKLDYTML